MVSSLKRGVVVDCGVACASLLPACGEKVRMRGITSLRFGQSPRPLTLALSPL
jgi:hypothetical protein